MLWWGRRFYDDRRPKIVISHPLLSLRHCFLLLPPSTHPHPTKPPRYTAHFTVGRNPEGRFLSLSLYLSPPFIAALAAKIAFRFILLAACVSMATSWNHGNYLNRAKRSFKTAAFTPPPPRASSQPVNVCACDCGYKWACDFIACVS